MFGGEYTQQTTSNENYTVDVTASLAGDTVASVVWSSAPTGLTLSTPVLTQNTIGTKAAGGVNGVAYLIKAVVTTAAGNAFTVYIILFINDQ